MFSILYSINWTAVIALVLLILTGAAYADFRNKVKKFALDFSECAALFYRFLCDILDGGDTDKALAAELKTRMEKLWTDAKILGPFIKDILDAKTKAVTRP